MVRQYFTLDKYGWQCTVFYAVTGYHLDEIIDSLYDIGCRGDDLETAYANISANRLDTGLTYSNLSERKTVIVVALASSSKEFEKSWRHECGHLATHICQAFDINPYGEEIHYIGDYIVERTWDCAKSILCDSCLQKREKYA